MKIIVVGLVLLSFNLYGSQILNCYEIATSSITAAVDLEKDTVNFDSTSKVKEDKNAKITFVVEDNKAILKGNNGNGIELVKMQDVFLEMVPPSAILWKLIYYENIKKQKEPYLFQMKAYNSFGPVSYTTLWKCE